MTIEPTERWLASKGVEYMTSHTSRPSRRPVGMRRMLLACGLGLVAIALVANTALAAPGGLDGTFSANGWVSTDFGTGADVAYDVAISDVDGSIVAVGSVGGSGGRFGVARYQPNGTLDTTFGGGDGKVVT